MASSQDLSKSPLLSVFKIHDSKSYKAWCLKNHPDKKPGDPDATRVFQEVQREYRTFTTGQPSASQCTKPQRGYTKDSEGIHDFMKAQRSSRCGVAVPGTTGGYCHMMKLSGYKTCFYHIPGTDHLKFLNPGERPESRFNILGNFASYNPVRTYSMCTARSKTGNWCTSAKVLGKETCKKHGEYKWVPPVVLEMHMSRSKEPLRVGFLNKTYMKKAHSRNFIYIRKNFGEVKSVTEVKSSQEPPTHILYENKLIPYDRFEK